jgi:PAS domain S-box-containing protein
MKPAHFCKQKPCPVTGLLIGLIAAIVFLATNLKFGLLTFLTYSAGVAGNKLCPRPRSKKDAIDRTIRDVTSLTETEIKLIRSEKLYQAIISSIPKSVTAVIDTSHRFIHIDGNDINPRRAIRKEFEGKLVAEVFNEKQYERIRGPLVRALSGEHSSYEVSTPEFTLQMICSPVRDEKDEIFAALIVSTDVTETKRADSALVKANLDLTGMISSIDEVFLSIDVLQKKLVLISPACESVYGYAAEAFLADMSLLSSVIHEEDRHIADGAFAILQRGERYYSEFRIIHADKSIRWIASKLIPVFDAGSNLVLIHGVSSDITSRKQAENMLQEKIAELNEYIYRTSHDLRGPVTSSMGLVQLIKKENHNEHLKNYIEMLHTTNARMADMLASFGTAAGISTHQVGKDHIGISEFLHALVDSLKFIPEAGQVQFELDITTTPVIVCDPELLGTVVQNLVHNSIIYRNVKKIPSVSVKFSENAGNLFLEVRDNGLGIQKEILPHIFDMFYRGNSYSKGSGLGLYIVKNAVQKLRGTIAVESETGIGTTFRISIPKL